MRKVYVYIFIFPLQHLDLVDEDAIFKTKMKITFYIQIIVIIKVM